MSLRARFESLLVRLLAALPRPLLRVLVGRPVVLDGQTLDVESQLAIRLLALAGHTPLDELDVAHARARVRADARQFEGPRFGVERVEHVRVGGAAGELDGRLYVPHDDDGAKGMLVYFHGGGFVVGDLDTHDNSCRFLARAAGVRVLSVDYRLAPEHRFPAAIDDALAAFRWAVERAPQLGGDPRRIAVGGDSAGGNLAAGVARLAAGGDEIGPAFQVLFYPWVDLSARRDSHRLFGDGFFLTQRDLDWYRRHYLGSEGDALNPRCSPLLADDLAGVAPAYVATAGFDPLRDEGEAYAESLRAAGVPVALRRHRGALHGFVNVAGVGRLGREALLEAAGALRVGLAAARR